MTMRRVEVPVGSRRRSGGGSRRPGADDGVGCHAGRDEMLKAAEAAGKSETLQRYAADYPLGPHDQPQSMCPAFGSLRVGLRMRRTASVLSRLGLLRLRADLHLAFLRRQAHGRLCAVQLRDAGHRQAVRGHARGGVHARRSRALRRHRRSPISACRPPPACRCGCCRRRSTACGSSASTCRASACRPMPRRRTCWPARCCAYARNEAEHGPVAAPRGGISEKPTVTLVGEMFPADPVGIGMMLEPHGACRRAGGADARMARALHARSTARSSPRSIRSIRASFREFEAAGRHYRRLGAGRRRRHGGLARCRSARRRHCRRKSATRRRTGSCRRSAPRSPRSPIKGRITLSGYEGSELLVARLLIESGADVRYVGTACPRTPWSDADRDWLEAKGVHVQYRASLEQDLAAFAEFKPDLAIGTTPVVQKAKESAHPGALFHQPDLRPSADGTSRRRLAGPGRQCRAGQPRALRRDGRLLRRHRQRRDGRHLGGHAASRSPNSASATAQAHGKRWPRQRKAEEMI